MHKWTFFNRLNFLFALEKAEKISFWHKWKKYKKYSHIIRIYQHMIKLMIKVCDRTKNSIYKGKRYKAMDDRKTALDFFANWVNIWFAKKVHFMQYFFNIYIPFKPTNKKVARYLKDATISTYLLCITLGRAAQFFILNSLSSFFGPLTFTSIKWYHTNLHNFIR